MDAGAAHPGVDCVDVIALHRHDTDLSRGRDCLSTPPFVWIVTTTDDPTLATWNFCWSAPHIAILVGSTRAVHLCRVETSEPAESFRFARGESYRSSG